MMDLWLGNFSLIINRRKRVKTNIMLGNDFSILIRAFESRASVNEQFNILSEIK